MDEVTLFKITKYVSWPPQFPIKVHEFISLSSNFQIIIVQIVIESTDIGMLFWTQDVSMAKRTQCLVTAYT